MHSTPAPYLQLSYNCSVREVARYLESFNRETLILVFLSRSVCAVRGGKEFNMLLLAALAAATLHATSTPNNTRSCLLLRGVLSTLMYVRLFLFLIIFLLIMH